MCVVLWEQKYRNADSFNARTYYQQMYADGMPLEQSHDYVQDVPDGKLRVASMLAASSSTPEMCRQKDEAAEHCMLRRKLFWTRVGHHFHPRHAAEHDQSVFCERPYIFHFFTILCSCDSTPMQTWKNNMPKPTSSTSLAFSWEALGIKCTAFEVGEM